MRTFSTAKPPEKKTRASILCHGLTGGGKTTFALTGGRPLVICTEVKAEAHVLRINPNAVCVVPESCNDLLKIIRQLGEPDFLAKGYTRIVLDSYTELANLLAGWIYSYQSGNNASPEIGRRISIEEYGPIQQWGISLIKAIQLSGLPSMIIVRSESKQFGRIQQIVPAGLGNSPKNLPAMLIPTVECHYDSALSEYVADTRPDDHSQRCGLPWVPQVFSGNADDYLSLVENGEGVSLASQKQPEQSESKPKRKPRQPKAENVAPTPTQTENKQPKAENVAPQPQAAIVQPVNTSTDYTQGLSDNQALELQSLLDKYRISTQVFITWAYSKTLLVDNIDVTAVDLADIRQDQWDYIHGLLNHDRSRIAFLQHLAALAKTA